MRDDAGGSAAEWCLGGAVDSQDGTNVRGTADLYPWLPGARSQWDGNS